MTAWDELDTLLDRSTPPPRPAFLDQPMATWEDRPQDSPQTVDEPRPMPGRHRAPSPRNLRRQARTTRKATRAKARRNCGHHPALWAFTWTTMALVAYLAGTFIGLPA